MRHYNLLLPFLIFCGSLFHNTLSSQVQLGGNIIGERTSDSFGHDIAFSSNGQRVAISSATNNDGAIDGGHVRVFDYQNNAWVQVGSDIDGTILGLQSGWAIDLSADGKRLVVLEPNYVNNGYAVGRVKVYQEVSGTWTQLGSSIIGQGSSQGADQLFYDVAMSQDGKRIALGTNNNRVKVYEEANGVWTQAGSNITAGGIVIFSDDMSVDLSADGKRLIVGTPVDNSMGNSRIFEESGGTWTQVGAPINGTTPSSRSGYAVAMSADGKRVAIGAPLHGPQDHGQISLYAESGGVWTQVGTSISGENSGDKFGWSIDISADGKRIIAGSIYNTGSGAQAGHARIYQENNNTLTQLGSDIDALGSYNLDGFTVALSHDGTILGLTAPRYNNYRGNARIFEVPVDPACVEQRTINSHYCTRRVQLLERTRTVHTSQIALGIDPGILPTGSGCTGSQAPWTHFNILTEAFPATGPMTTPATQQTLNNIPVSDLYTVPGSNLQFYNVPTTAVAMMLTGPGSNVYRLRVTITGVNGTVVSNHSAQYILTVSPDQSYLCTSPSNNGGLSR